MTDFQQSDFYRAIVDNNIFRPLGWVPPRPVEPYRLLGTLIPTDKNRQPEAIHQTTDGNTLHIVTIGDKLGTDTEVVSIENKAVTLSTKGKQRKLHLPIRF